MTECNEDKNLGVIETIVNDITSAKLKQAIILSEVVGKPACKKRGKRRLGK